MPETHRPTRMDTMERVGQLDDAMGRLDQALNSTEASDKDRIAGLTAIVNGQAAILAAGSGGQRRPR